MVLKVLILESCWNCGFRETSSVFLGDLIHSKDHTSLGLNPNKCYIFRIIRHKSGLWGVLGIIIFLLSLIYQRGHKISDYGRSANRPLLHMRLLQYSGFQHNFCWFFRPCFSLKRDYSQIQTVLLRSGATSMSIANCILYWKFWVTMWQLPRLVMDVGDEICRWQL